MTEIQKDFMELYAKVAAFQGMDQLLAKVFAMVYLESEDISLDELANDTGYSLASISNKVSILDRMGFVTKIRKPGEKKIYVKADKNYLSIMKDVMVENQRRAVNLICEEIPKMIDHHDKKNASKKTKEQIRILKDYQKQLNTANDIMSKVIGMFDESIGNYGKR